MQFVNILKFCSTPAAQKENLTHLHPWNWGSTCRPDGNHLEIFASVVHDQELWLLFFGCDPHSGSTVIHKTLLLTKNIHEVIQILVFSLVNGHKQNDVLIALHSVWAFCCVLKMVVNLTTFILKLFVFWEQTSWGQTICCDAFLNKQIAFNKTVTMSSHFPLLLGFPHHSHWLMLFI